MFMHGYPAEYSSVQRVSYPQGLINEFMHQPGFSEATGFGYALGQLAAVSGVEPSDTNLDSRRQVTDETLTMRGDLCGVHICDRVVSKIASVSSPQSQTKSFSVARSCATRIDVVSVWPTSSGRARQNRREKPLLYVASRSSREKDQEQVDIEQALPRLGPSPRSSAGRSISST